MCGRFSLSVNRVEMDNYLEEFYNIEKHVEAIDLPRYNVAPGQNVLSVIFYENNYHAGLLKWGFIPNYAKSENVGTKIINAKAETLIEKRAFINSFKHRRCVVLANGFYEWQRVGKKKTPYRFCHKDSGIFPMAGLWSTFLKPDGTKIYSCTIITTAANKLVKNIHDRMPVILSEEMRKIWLDPGMTDLRTLTNMLVSADDELLISYEVSSVVNNALNELPECIEPINA